MAVMLALQQVLACCCFQLFVLFNKIDLIYIEVLNRNVMFYFFLILTKYSRVACQVGMKLRF